MLAEVIEKEQYFNSLLSAGKTKSIPSPGLITAARDWSAAVWAAATQAAPLQLSEEQLIRGAELAKNPVFIFGVHRSGTTLLRDLLDGHPELTVLPSEGTYYTNLEFKLQGLPDNQQIEYLTGEWLRRLANPINQAPYWLLGRSTAVSSPYIDFVQYVKAWWAILDHIPGTQWPHMAIVLAYASCTGNSTARLWVDKTPTNELFLDRIRQEMPSAKIIHMVREPVATFSSYKKMDPSASPAQLLHRLKSSFRIASHQAALNDPNFMLLRYEDLCEKPLAAMEKIAAFLHIQPSAILQQATVAGTPVQANSSFKREGKAGMILKPEEHRRDDIFDKEEQQLIAAYLKKSAAKHNYVLPEVSFLKKIYLMIKYRIFK